MSPLLHITQTVLTTMATLTIHHTALLYSILLLIFSPPWASSKLVEIDKGYIRGRTMHVHLDRGHKGHHSKKVDVFYSIPYARPPVGELRFVHPEQIDRWDGILDARRMPNSCMQEPDLFFGSSFRGSNVWNANTNVSEDCLYLNVWAPHTGHEAITADKAVMVWIYGGSFTTGTSTLDIYDGRYLAAAEDVVVVSMQFRFGALGYLTLGSPKSVGNSGMMDIRMALEWVKNNIHKFGGSDRNVTLVGESSGAVSVGLFMLSPLGRGLFHRAIMQSASPLAHWGTTTLEEGSRRSKMLARRLGCDTDQSDLDILHCLRKVPAHKFPQEELNITNGIAQFPFVPVIDGTFLRKTPKEYLEDGSFKKTPVLMGSNANEGTWLLVYSEPTLFNLNTSGGISYHNHQEALGRLFEYYPQFPTPLGQLGKDAVRFQYTNWSKSHDHHSLGSEVEQAVGDLHFVCCVNDMASVVASYGHDVFVYRFSHRMSNNPWPKWMGVLHGDELFFTFGSPLNKRNNFTDDEKQLSMKMMKLWANFAKTGDPNPSAGTTDNSHGLPLWPTYSADRQRYLEIDLNILQNKHNWREGLKPQHCAFWKEFLPSLANLGTSAAEADCSRSSAATSGGQSLTTNPNVQWMSLSLIVLCVYAIISAIVVIF